MASPAEPSSAGSLGFTLFESSDTFFSQSLHFHPNPSDDYLAFKQLGVCALWKRSFLLVLFEVLIGFSLHFHFNFQCGRRLPAVAAAWVSGFCPPKDVNLVMDYRSGLRDMCHLLGTYGLDFISFRSQGWLSSFCLVGSRDPFLSAQSPESVILRRRSNSLTYWWHRMFDGMQVVWGEAALAKQHHFQLYFHVLSDHGRQEKFSQKAAAIGLRIR